jgi:hypothetical protein
VAAFNWEGTASLARPVTALADGIAVASSIHARQPPWFEIIHGHVVKRPAKFKNLAASSSRSQLAG